MDIDDAIKVAEAATPGPAWGGMGDAKKREALGLSMVYFDPPTVLALLRFVKAVEAYMGAVSAKDERAAVALVKQTRAAVDEALK